MEELYQLTSHDITPIHLLQDYKYYQYAIILKINKTNENKTVFKIIFIKQKHQK